jgi:hypothetical protein
VAATFAANGAQSGGNINGDPVTVENTIVADATTGGSCFGALTSAGYNLSDDGTCDLDDPTDQPDVEGAELKPWTTPGDRHRPTRCGASALPSTRESAPVSAETSVAGGDR